MLTALSIIIFVFEYYIQILVAISIVAKNAKLVVCSELFSYC